VLYSLRKGKIIEIMKKIVLTHKLDENVMKSLEEKFNIDIANSGNPDEIYPLLKNANGIIVRIGYLDRKTIMSLNNLEVIGRTGVGVDNIDLLAANERGIPVVVTPGANTRSVAEHALALILALSKDLKTNDMEMHKGNYNIRNNCESFEVFGKTLGIIGFGNIGQEVAKLCSSIGLKILVYDPFVKPEIVEERGFQFTEQLELLLRKSDIISIHVALTKDTTGMIGTKEFNMMKPSVIIINCARGSIINEKALVEALKNNKIRGAGLDVFSSEPIDNSNPILEFKNVITTPHIAGLTGESFFTMSKMVADGVSAVLRGEKWPYIANKEVYKHSKWLQKN